MKKARLIYNPSSGKEQIESNLGSILQVYEQAGYETSAFRTTKDPNSAEEEARRVALEGFDLIIAAGGDGTISDVISGISGLESRPDVAVLPGGTTNDFAHALGVASDSLVESARHIERQEFIPMDVGLATYEDRSEYFINVAAAGEMTKLTYEVSTKMKSIFGYLAYVSKALEKLPNSTPIYIRVTYDGEIFEGEALVVFLALTNTMGGYENIAPDKIPGDGNFTLIIVQPGNLIENSSLILKVIDGGKHAEHKNVIYSKAKEVKLETFEKKGLPINIDGDRGGETPVVFSNLQGHIRFVVNTKNMVNSFDLQEDEGTSLKKEFMQKIADYDRKNKEKDV